MDRLDAIAAFVTIADRGSFAAAAREHRVSPQAVTRAIAGLEARLGVQLLRRTTRSVRLTEEGALFLARARQVLADLQDAELMVMGARAEPRGTLVVTAPALFGRLHVVPVAAELLRRHPRLTVRLLLLDRVVQLVEEGVDVAVRIGDLGDSAHHAVRLGEVRRILVASPAYLDAQGEPQTVSDLRRHQIVAFTGASGSDDWRFGPEEKQAVHVRPRLVVNGADAAIAAAEAGLGITRVLSYQAGGRIAEGRLRTVLDAAAPPALPVSLLFQANRGASPKVRAFIELARDQLRNASW
ncbi:MAG TPA: LysR family transcriptional regulator [Alphaproteobacteria bacterium]|nr:LysR family transcriptional regulator [Alphaproteobacteria bacterium]